jgi:hypothetical protein
MKTLNKIFLRISILIFILSIIAILITIFWFIPEILCIFLFYLLEMEIWDYESNEMSKNELNSKMNNVLDPNNSDNTINHSSDNNNTSINHSDNLINHSSDNIDLTNNQSNNSDSESIESDSTINHRNIRHRYTDSDLFTNPTGYKFTSVNNNYYSYIPVSELNSDSMNSSINANNSNINEDLNNVNNPNINESLNNTNNSNINEDLRDVNNFNINESLNNTNDSNINEDLRDVNNKNNREFKGLRKSLSMGNLPEKTNPETPIVSPRFKIIKKILSSLNLRKK